MATADLAELLPGPLRNAFQDHYAKQDPVHYSMDYCSRCGASVAIDSEAMFLHKIWHKNVSCQLWMIARFPQEHLLQHQEEGRVIAELIGNILGFIDPPDDENVDAGTVEIVGDDGRTVAHVHQDGTAHEH